MRRIWITVGALLGAVASAAAAAAGPAQRQDVQGSWQSIVNCAFTSYDLPSGRMSCLGSTAWTGGLTGVTRYVATGSYDPLSGDSSGELQETFYGKDDTGRQGTIAFLEDYVLDGAASSISITARAVSGTGDFAGVAGTLTFTGTDNAAVGFGGFSGVLHMGRR